MSDLIARMQDMVDFKHDDMDVAREAIEEIARLRVELATARREGMDEAARMMIDLRQETTWEEHPQYGQICVIRNRTSEEIAAAIRAAAKEGK